MSNIKELQMLNLSFGREPLTLVIGKNYIVIDALYLEDIKKRFKNINHFDFKNEIRNKIFAFPYTNVPFAEFRATQNYFTIDSIKRVSIQELNQANHNVFAVDSGIIIFIIEDIFIDFITKGDFSFGNLVDSPNQPIDLRYWEKLITSYPTNYIGLVSSPGIDAGVDFIGSGTYKV